MDVGRVSRAKRFLDVGANPVELAPDCLNVGFAEMCVGGDMADSQ